MLLHGSGFVLGVRGSLIQEEGEEIDLGELESATPPKPAIALEWLYEPGEVKVLYYGDMEEYKKIPRVPQAGLPDCGPRVRKRRLLSAESQGHTRFC